MLDSYADKVVLTKMKVSAANVIFIIGWKVNFDEIGNI